MLRARLANRFDNMAKEACLVNRYERRSLDSMRDAPVSRERPDRIPAGETSNAAGLTLMNHTSRFRNAVTHAVAKSL
jgi:hypothetical protein